jgi:hypothetical protein
MFAKFLTTFLPAHKDKELCISPLLFKCHPFSQILSPPLPFQVCRAGFAFNTIVIITSAPPRALGPCKADPLPDTPSTTRKPSHLLLPVALEFQAPFFPNMAETGAPISTLGKQPREESIPVVTFTAITVSSLAATLEGVSVVGNVCPSETLVFKEHQISQGRSDINFTLFTSSNLPPLYLATKTTPLVCFCSRNPHPMVIDLCRPPRGHHLLEEMQGDLEG